MDDIRCNFCGKSQGYVEKMIRSPEDTDCNTQDIKLSSAKATVKLSISVITYICDRCVSECVAILREGYRVPLAEEQY